MRMIMQPIIHQNHIDITPDVLMMLGVDVRNLPLEADGRSGHRDSSDRSGAKRVPGPAIVAKAN